MRDKLIESLSERFEIEASLGSGSFAKVYAARDKHLGRPVALKVLRNHSALSKETRARFQREAKILSEINHPNVMKVLHFGLIDNQHPYISTERLDGETLQAKLLREDTLPAETVERFTAQICQGLMAVHDRGILHRDIKPENIFCCTDGTLKLLDFGLCGYQRSTSAQQQITQENAALGSVAYMSPEMCTEPGSIDKRSDLYSLGCVIFEMLVGTHPFNRAGTMEMMWAQTNDEVTWPGDLPPNTQKMVFIAKKLLKKKPSERFSSAEDILAAIDSKHSNFRDVNSRVIKFSVTLTVSCVIGLSIWTLLERYKSRQETNEASKDISRAIKRKNANASLQDVSTLRAQGKSLQAAQLAEQIANELAFPDGDRVYQTASTEYAKAGQFDKSIDMLMKIGDQNNSVASQINLVLLQTSGTNLKKAASLADTVEKWALQRQLPESFWSRFRAIQAWILVRLDPHSLKAEQLLEKISFIGWSAADYDYLDAYVAATKELILSGAANAQELPSRVPKYLRDDRRVAARLLRLEACTFFTKKDYSSMKRELEKARALEPNKLAQRDIEAEIKLAKTLLEEHKNHL